MTSSASGSVSFWVSPTSMSIVTEAAEPYGRSGEVAKGQSSSFSRLPGVQRIAQAVTDEVDGKGDEDDEHAREVEEPRPGVDRALLAGDQDAERRVGGLDAEADERQGRLEQDSGG